jgi:hypothetical protein
MVTMAWPATNPVPQWCHLHRILTSYFGYCHKARTNLSLGKEQPEPRAVQPASMGDIVDRSEVGGLHRR